MIKKGTNVRVVYTPISKPVTIIGIVNNVLLAPDKTTVNGYVVNGAYISTRDLVSIEEI